MSRVLSIALLLLTMTSQARANVLQLEVNGTFTGGGTFTGIFALDNVGQSVVSANITTSSESGFPGSNYVITGSNPATVRPFGTEAFAIILPRTTGQGSLAFWLPGTPQTFTGGDILTDVAGCATERCAASQESFVNPLLDVEVTRTISGGTVVAVPVAVPEPSSAMLLLAGLGAFAVVAGRRQRTG